MGTQGTGRKRSTNKERTTAEDDALNLIAREAEARLAAKRAARAEAREIRMKELERQQKEIFQVQKKYYGLDPKLDDRADSKWGDIEQWMEDSERYSRPSRSHMQDTSCHTPLLSDDDERMSVGSRGSVRSDVDAVGAYGGGGSSSYSHKKSKKKKKHKHKDRDRNGYDDDYSVMSSRSSRLSDESRASRSSRLDLTASYVSSDLYSLNGLSSRNQGSAFNGYQSSLYEDSLCSGSRRVTGSSSHPLEYTSYHSSGSRASSRAGSARASPVDNCGSVASFLRSAASSSGLPRDLDDVTIPDFSDVEDRDYLEKGSRAASALTAGTLTSLGGTSSRRGSGETAINVDAETSLREIKEIHELKDQIQDVETKYTQNLKELKDALAEVEEKYRKAMVSNAQLDNEKNNLMYHVDTLKDSLMEMEELLSESRREYEEKVKEFEREKHAHGVLQFQFSEMKETLKQSEELLNEIRQLRMKQDGFTREISDLQETVEWKDKKIGALERQKEYTDAIRVERDELREEVVKLKDILKKHGIVLGPDLNINGDIGETDTDASPSGDATTPTAQDSQTSPTEGNSMLGNTEETETRSSTKEEVEPQQHQEFLKKTKDNHLSSDAVCNATDVSKLETSMEEQTEQQTCSTMESSVREKDLKKDVNVDTNEASVPDDKVTSPEENGSGTETFEKENLEETTYPDVGQTETNTNETTQIRDNPSEGEGNQPDEVDSIKLNQSESCPQQEVTEGEIKESLPDESIPAVSKPELEQEPKTLEERENEEAEEASNKSQPQGTSAAGKKKKKRKRGKKKGGTNEDKTQEKAETEKYDGKPVEDIRSDPKDNGSATEPVTDGSVAETVRESKMDQVTKEEDDGQKNEEEKPVEAAETTLSYADILKKDIESKETETVAAVEPTEASHIEKEQMTNVDVTEKEEILENEKIVVEGVMPSETFNDNVEESGSDIITHEQDKEGTLETEKEAGPVTSPNQESNQIISHLVGNSEGTENSNGLEEDGTSCIDDSQSAADVPPSGDFKTETVDEITSEQTSNSPENPAETNSDPESCAAGSTDVGVESIGVNVTTSTVQLPDEEITVGLQSSSPSEPSVVTEADTDAHIDFPHETETSIDGTNTEAETEQKPSSIIPSPEEDSEENLVETGQKEQNGESGEVKNSGCSPVFSRLEERFDAENGPMVTVIQGDNEESQTQCVAQIDESNAEVSLTTTVMDTAASDSQVVAEVEAELSSQNVEDPEFKNAENNAETSVEQPEECRNDESEGESVSMDQDMDKDDDEDEDEGQSFDFDDLEMESFIADPRDLRELLGQDEEADEAVPDEILELCQNNTEPQLEIQRKVPENNSEALPIDESSEAEALDKEPESVHQNEQTSLASAEAMPVNVCEEQKNVSEEEAGTTEDPKNVVEGLNVTVVEKDDQAMSSSVEEGVDVIKYEMQEKDSPNTSQMSSNSEPAPSGKDVKKNSKKGKSKGKEECKMS